MLGTAYNVHVCTLVNIDALWRCCAGKLNNHFINQLIQTIWWVTINIYKCWFIKLNLLYIHCLLQIFPELCSCLPASPEWCCRIVQTTHPHAVSVLKRRCKIKDHLTCLSPKETIICTVLYCEFLYSIPHLIFPGK